LFFTQQFFLWFRFFLLFFWGEEKLKELCTLLETGFLFILCFWFLFLFSQRKIAKIAKENVSPYFSS